MVSRRLGVVHWEKNWVTLDTYDPHWQPSLSRREIGLPSASQTEASVTTYSRSVGGAVEGRFAASVPARRRGTRRAGMRLVGGRSGRCGAGARWGRDAGGRLQRPPTSQEPKWVHADRVCQPVQDEPDPGQTPPMSEGTKGAKPVVRDTDVSDDSCPDSRSK